MNFLTTILIALWPEPKTKRDNKKLANTNVSRLGKSGTYGDYIFAPGFDSDKVWLHAEVNQWIRKYSDDFFVEIKRKEYDGYRVTLYYQNCEAKAMDVFKTVDDAKQWVDDNAISFKDSVKSVRADMQAKNKKTGEIILKNKRSSNSIKSQNNASASSNDWIKILRAIAIIFVLFLFLASGSWNWISLILIGLFIIFIIIITK